MGGLWGLDGHLRPGLDAWTAGRTGEAVPAARGAAQEMIKDGGKGAQIWEDSRKDRVTLSENREPDDLERSAREFIDSMKQYYPDIRFHMPGQDSAAASPQTAAGFGKGMHIVISSEFLERMGSSREEFDKCSKVLSAEAAKLLKQAGTSAGAGVFLEKDRVIAWSASVKPQEPVLPVTGSELKEMTTAKINTQGYSYRAQINVSGHYNKMASARDSSQVQRVIGDIYQSMATLKITTICGDDEERIKALRAVRSLQKLLHRGNRKLRRLNREKLKQVAHKKAQKQKEERKSRQLELELKKMRSARKGADCRLVQEGMADEAHIRGYRRYKGLPDPFEPYALAPGDMVTLQSLPGVDMGMAGGGFGAGDITFSGEYSF